MVELGLGGLRALARVEESLTKSLRRPLAPVCKGLDYCLVAIYDVEVGPDNWCDWVTVDPELNACCTWLCNTTSCVGCHGVPSELKEDVLSELRDVNEHLAEIQLSEAQGGTKEKLLLEV